MDSYKTQNGMGHTILKRTVFSNLIAILIAYSYRTTRAETNIQIIWVFAQKIRIWIYDETLLC